MKQARTNYLPNANNCATRSHGPSNHAILGITIRLCTSLFCIQALSGVALYFLRVASFRLRKNSNLAMKSQGRATEKFSSLKVLSTTSYSEILRFGLPYSETQRRIFIFRGPMPHLVPILGTDFHSQKGNLAAGTLSASAGSK